jgi:hypothetical protein
MVPARRHRRQARRGGSSNGVSFVDEPCQAPGQNVCNSSHSRLNFALRGPARHNQLRHNRLRHNQFRHNPLRRRRTRHRGLIAWVGVEGKASFGVPATSASECPVLKTIHANAMIRFDRHRGHVAAASQALLRGLREQRKAPPNTAQSSVPHQVRVKHFCGPLPASRVGNHCVNSGAYRTTEGQRGKSAPRAAVTTASDRPIRRASIHFSPPPTNAGIKVLDSLPH